MPGSDVQRAAWSSFRIAGETLALQGLPFLLLFFRCRLPNRPDQLSDQQLRDLLEPDEG
jgi:hypothetical protein